MKMSKIAAIVAAAALLVIGAAFTSMAATYDWQLENGEWVCYDKDGYQYYDTWAQSASGDWYYLGDEGVMATNQKLEYKTHTVYVGADGSWQKNFWAKINNDDEDNTYNYYYFNEKGYMVKNSKVDVGDKTYCFDGDGKMLSGWVVASGSKCYYAAGDSKNAPQGTALYYCGGADDGAMFKGDWKKIDIGTEDEPSEKWFYFQTSGKLFKAPDAKAFVTKKINGATYAFDNYGVMQSEWIAPATAGIASQSYYSDPEVGAQVTKGWFQAYKPGEDQDKIDEGDATLNWYYAVGKGELAKSEIKKINGKYYCFNENGVMQSGLVWVTFKDATASAAARAIEKVEAISSDWNADNFETALANTTAVANKYLYYFSGDGAKDGSMKFGQQKVTVDDEQFTLYFKANSTSERGRAISETKTTGIYFNGVKLSAGAEARYAFVKATIDPKTEAITCTDPKVYYAYELKTGKPSGYLCINAAGRVLKTLGGSKDGDDYKITVADWSKITIE